MTGNAKELCDICRREAVLRIAGSSLGPVTLGYCPECVSRNAEPLQLIATAIMLRDGAGSDDLEDLQELQTYDEGAYRDFAHVLAIYPEMEDTLREAFFGEPDER